MRPLQSAWRCKLLDMQSVGYVCLFGALPYDPSAWLQSSECVRVNRYTGRKGYMIVHVRVQSEATYFVIDQLGNEHLLPFNSMARRSRQRPGQRVCPR
jgi:hypothetical protein